MGVLEEVLLKEGYGSTSELAQDWALMTALSRLEQYRAECEFFERKYGMKFDAFDKTLHRKKGEEDFEKEEELEDWEFALNAQKWWEEQAKELQRAARS